MADTKAKKTSSVKLVETLKGFLGSKCPVEWMDEEMTLWVADGNPSPSLGEALVRKVVKLASDPNKANRWAMELVFDRVCGKSVQSAAPRVPGRDIEDDLDRIGVEHLSRLTSQFVQGEKASGVAATSEAKDEASGPAQVLLDLPSDRPDGSKNAGE